MKAREEFESCARRLKALADPDRLRIIDLLFAGPRNVSDLAELLDDEIVKVSHHLGVLRRAELVQTQKEGRHVRYALHADISQSPHAIELGCCRLVLPIADGALPALKRRS
jgi:DNA-binding transcriptional ArsR family regulator